MEKLQDRYNPTIDDGIWASRPGMLRPVEKISEFRVSFY